MSVNAGFQSTDFTFTADEDLIGFYGKKSTTAITKLGFIVRDNKCIADAKQAEIDEANAQAEAEINANANITPTAPDSSETEEVDKGPFTESIAFVVIIFAIVSMM